MAAAMDSVLVLALRVGPIEFEAPVWLWLFPIGAALTLWWGRASLSGLATTMRRAALVLRLLVILLIAAALAEPQWRKESRDVAVTAVLDASRSVPLTWQKHSEQYVEDARKANAERKEDRLGVVTVTSEAIVQSLPSKLTDRVEKGLLGSTLGTNLAAGVRLALATRPQDAAYRLLLITDGNETTGSLLEAAEAARAVNVPIDVLPIRYNFEHEVIVDQLIAPMTARMGENLNLRVVMTSTSPAQGRLSILINGDPVDLDPDEPGFGKTIDLEPGTNVMSVPVTVPRAGPQEFKAIYEPLETAEGRRDAILENNEQLAVTFVAGEGRVLMITEVPDEMQPLLSALQQAKITVEVMSADQAPKTLTELNGFDAIILANEPAYNFSLQTQDNLKAYVHETGGGLIKLGGPDSFGAGGWIGSPLEDALPVRLDPPQKRQMPRGALVLISHSIEMPDGMSWGKKTAQAAVDALSRLDLAGIVEYDPRRAGGATWVHPIAEVGDGSAIRRSIQNLAFGDMPDYDPAMTLALQGLMNADAGAKHVVMITDGDASMPSQRLLQMYRKERVTISTVGVYPHTAADLQKLATIAQQTGGRHYEVVNQGGLGQIVQIFIKEAQTVKRSLIWEGTPFVPALTGAPVETMRGIGGVAPLSGYVVTGDREGLAMVTLRGKENDPIMAVWHYGLGRVVAYTSDATSRWNPAWVGWPGYKAFWEQHVRWAMRPSGSANVRVTTEKAGDQTRVIVEALDQEGERLNFARFRGRVAGPEGKGQDIDLQQVGPGRYEGRFDSQDAGSYVVSMRYAAPNPQGGEIMEGSVQASVTKPFADEFRALTDNMPLLQQVANMTGGRVLAGDPRGDDLWRREGVMMPVATRPIWILVAIFAIGVFLMDVGIRRVRVDIPAIARMAMRALQTRGEKAGAQMDSLRTAREKARRSIAARAATEQGVDAARVAMAQQPAVAKVKFEASPERVRKQGDRPVALGGEAEPTPVIVKKAKHDISKEEGLSRLMQAKKRARDDMND
jgi:uncharacterized membrane protein